MKDTNLFKLCVLLRENQFEYVCFPINVTAKMPLISASQCADDQSFDCARTSTFFDICSDIQRAKIVCPLFCSLCDLGKQN